MGTKNSYILLLLLLLISCNQHTRDSQFGDNKEIVHINGIKRFDHINEFIPEEFIINKEYIKLRSTHDNFLFKEINKIRLINDKIFILDGRLKKLLVFNKNGLSVAAIGAKGNGPNEYIDIADFDVDKEGTIYTIDGRLDKLFIYNPDYSLKKVMALPFEADIISVVENNKIIFGLSDWNKGNNEGASIIVTDKDLNTLNIVSYYDKYIDNAFWVSHYSFVNTSKNILYNKPINNTILVLSKKGILEKVIEFDFGRKNVPPKHRKEIEKNLNQFNSYNLLKWITIIEDDYLIGTFWENRETKSFFIDRKKNELFVSNSTIDRDIGNVAGFDNKTLIKFIIPGSERAEENDLPQDVKEHLYNGDFVLVLYRLI
ncbi:6-bladed beta-propeller [Proteiniphilum acetatigenes]|uniref:6-bladed beta-propeller n=1 Tax=Proteiniphilum acetatigenes TaxID=294710 RepID=UPI0003620D53|nr:6-bladed beta-propeller [Proteiniphilum acetatigenes]SFL51698.1 6-bladed beta-propeller protein [Porphyromonadaceae bacterium KH3CP3RA]